MRNTHFFQSDLESKFSQFLGNIIHSRLSLYRTRGPRPDIFRQVRYLSISILVRQRRLAQDDQLANQVWRILLSRACGFAHSIRRLWWKALILGNGYSSHEKKGGDWKAHEVLWMFGEADRIRILMGSISWMPLHDRCWPVGGKIP